MPRYTAWKTVIDGAERTHRSENATYRWLREQAPNLAEGTAITVQVRDGSRWGLYETLTVRDGQPGSPSARDGLDQTARQAMDDDRLPPDPEDYADYSHHD